MFRNPRENAKLSPEALLKPSTGRPPTPPSSSLSSPAMASAKTRPPPVSTPRTPLSSRKAPSSLSASKNTGSRAAKTRSNGMPSKTNGSILNFFKKAPPSELQKAENTECQNDGLFLPDDDSFQYADIENAKNLGTHRESDWNAQLEEDGGDRFNERSESIKRRKVEGNNIETSNVNGKNQQGQAHGSAADERDLEVTQPSKIEGVQLAGSDSIEHEGFNSADVQAIENATMANSTSLDPNEAGMPEKDEFEDLGDFDDDYLEGEEFMERQWMIREQRAFELAENGGFEDDPHTKLEDSSTPTCPICSASLAGVSNDDATKHVNHCLDGDPLPPPEAKNPAKEEATPLNKFKKPPRPPKPGQADPFSLVKPGAPSSSAFSKLMSSHAEDAAWASAAAAETAARGKPAYQRTCPFYKILPGFNICVDAFRYGAVEGCKAYFLSHFHSDHYIGLTSHWEHGPIYCSRVTANLVRQQLRVDPKRVVDLDFEAKVPVPNTNGVEVTMISANHCPGSSLFLFEKSMGSNKNSKIQRVLHCGDFRACPAHVTHPALRPDLVNSVTGKAEGQQKLDVCYLDTTYLNPRYAFPCQEEVIEACADMCVSLKKEKADASDDWERTKRERAGDGMMKFVRKDSDNSKQTENSNGVDAMSIHHTSSNKDRGRLLVVVGTYSIGKERICVGVAKKLGTKIYASAGKQRICACLEDPELDSLLTSDPLEAQVHMTPLFEIRAETLQEYLNAYKPHFSRVVGFRPSGWNYRPPKSRFLENPNIQTVLHSSNWKSTYSMSELEPQRGSTREASCFGVPYSEHSSFRELTMFCCALRIDKIIPTVNVGSAKSREKMKVWIDKWAADKKKNGLFKPNPDATTW